MGITSIQDYNIVFVRIQCVVGGDAVCALLVVAIHVGVVLGTHATGHGNLDEVGGRLAAPVGLVRHDLLRPSPYKKVRERGRTYFPGC